MAYLFLYTRELDGVWNAACYEQSTFTFGQTLEEAKAYALEALSLMLDREVDPDEIEHAIEYWCPYPDET